jgi:hypothetical protein
MPLSKYQYFKHTPGCTTLWVNYRTFRFSESFDTDPLKPGDIVRRQAYNDANPDIQFHFGIITSVGGSVDSTVLIHLDDTRKDQDREGIKPKEISFRDFMRSFTVFDLMDYSDMDYEYFNDSFVYNYISGCKNSARKATEKAYLACHSKQEGKIGTGKIETYKYDNSEDFVLRCLFDNIRLKSSQVHEVTERSRFSLVRIFVNLRLFLCCTTVKRYPLFVNHNYFRNV